MLPMLMLILMLLSMLMLACGAVAMLAADTGAWLTPALCHAAGLVLTLALAARLTPASWWRRPTVRGLAIVAGGTWLCGGALALATGPAAPTAPTPALAWASPAQAPGTPRQAADIPILPFRVHRSLNLRAGPDVGSARLAVIPAGAELRPTGKRSGDWWQVDWRQAGGGNGPGRQTGWVSSLWLRQLAERQH